MSIEVSAQPAPGRGMAAIALQIDEHAAGADAAEQALAAIDSVGGVWLGCDVQAPELFRREAKAAVEPLLAFYLDGRLLSVVPHGDVGRALAARLHLGALAGFDAVHGRLERRFEPAAGGPHAVIGVLRAVLRAFSIDPRRVRALRHAGFRLLPAGRRAMRCPTTVGAGWCCSCRRGCCAATKQASAGCTSAFPGLVPVPGPAAQIDAVAPPALDQDLPAGAHAAAVARGVERMREGALCSLVLSQTFRRRIRGDRVDAPQAFARLRRDNPYPAMFFAHLGGGEKVFGASPDIQVRADAHWVETAPVCGTFRRGADPVDDHEQAKALINSQVDEASLALCADSDRNDKALVCVPGSVELVSRRRVHFFATILHTIDHTRGVRRAGVDGFDIVLAHATPATVTGMPKTLARAGDRRARGRLARLVCRRRGAHRQRWQLRGADDAALRAADRRHRRGAHRRLAARRFRSAARGGRDAAEGRDDVSRAGRPLAAVRPARPPRWRACRCASSTAATRWRRWRARRWCRPAANGPTDGPTMRRCACWATDRCRGGWMPLARTTTRPRHRRWR